MAYMIGELEKIDGTIEGEIESITPVIEGEISNITPIIDGTIETIDTLVPLDGELVILPTIEAPPYIGSYEAPPVAYADIILNTSGKRMENDVVISEIPYYETSNESGGYTVIIG